MMTLLVACPLALLLPATTRPVLLPQSLPPRLLRRRAADEPRCVDIISPMGGPLEPVEDEEEVPEVEFVRPPPEYPEGLHDAAKADRSGPFWSSLGEPDASTGVRPSYLRRDDWHISSTYTAERRAAVAAEESAYIETVTIETPEDDFEEDDDDFDPFAEREYMKLEPGPPVSGAKPSEYEMPNTWQAYQSLQAQFATLSASDSPLDEAGRAAASQHLTELNDFYETFKDILQQGWSLLNNVEVENAVKFATKHDPDSKAWRPT